MAITNSHDKKSIPTTREEFARTVEALASKSAEAREQVARATGRLRDTAVHVGRLVEEKTPDVNLDSVRGKAGRAGAKARSNRTALIAAAGVLSAAVLARRSRRTRRAARQG